jgi:peptidyl-prolyl cis-trans isomerase D
MGIIGSIRKHSWIAVVVVGAAIIAFIIGDLTKNNRGIPDMGKINGSTITYQRFNELIEETENNYMRQQGISQIPADVEYQLRDQVWQTLVGETLTDEQFDKLGLTVSPAELNDMYVGTFIHPYLRQSFTDPKTGQYQTEAIQYYVDNFDDLDTAQRMQWVELEKAVKADRKQQKYSALISRGMYMPNNIAKQLVAMGNKVSNAYAINLPYQSVSDQEITLTDEDYQKYYKEHKAEFRIREALRDIEYIVYPVVPTAQDLANIQADVEKTWGEFQTVDPEELIFFVNAESDRSYDSSYRKATEFGSPLDSAIMAAGEGTLISPRKVGNEWVMAKVLKVANRPDSMRASIIYIYNEKAGGNITRSDEQAKLLADSVLNIVRSGSMSFEEAVNQYSEDPQKANNNGDLQWQLDGNFGFLNEDIYNNPEGNAFIAKFPNEVGYMVVKVTGKTPLHKKYRVAAITRTIAASENTSRSVYNNANRFAGNNRPYAEMIATAQAENLQVRSGRINSMSYSLPGINNARNIIQWAFNEKTEAGDVADQIFEADDMFIVAALKEVYNPGFATLEQVRSSIENSVRIEKKAELLKARLEEAKQANANLTAIAAKMSVAIDTLDSISFNDYYLGKYGMEPKVQAAIVAAQPNTLIGPIQGANGVYMINVNTKVDNPVPEDVATVRSRKENVFMQGLRGIQQVLKDHAKIIDQRNKFF